MRSEKEIREEWDKWMRRGERAIEEGNYQWFVLCQQFAGILRWVLEEE